MTQTTIDYDRAGIAVAERLAEGKATQLPSRFWKKEGLEIALSAYQHGASNFTLLDSLLGFIWVVPGIPSEGATDSSDTVLMVATDLTVDFPSD